MSESYKIHHRFLNASSVDCNFTIFREEEDQGYYLQSIIPYNEYKSIAVFRRDIIKCVENKT